VDGGSGRGAALPPSPFGCAPLDLAPGAHPASPPG